MLLVCVWARFKPAHVSSWHSRVCCLCFAPNTGYSFPCNTYTARPGTWVLNVLIMPPHLGLSALCFCFSLLHVGFVITLMPLVVLVLAATLETSWKDCVSLELHLRDIRRWVGAVFLVALKRTSTHTLHHMLFAFSPFPVAAFYCILLNLLKWAMESPTSCVSITSSSGESFAHNMWNPLMEVWFHEQISGVFEPFVDEIDVAKIALSCHFAPDSLCHEEGDHDFAWRNTGHRCCHQTFFVISRTRPSRPSSIALWQPSSWPWRDRLSMCMQVDAQQETLACGDWFPLFTVTGCTEFSNFSATVTTFWKLFDTTSTGGSRVTALHQWHLAGGFRGNRAPVSGWKSRTQFHYN